MKFLVLKLRNLQFVNVELLGDEIRHISEPVNKTSRSFKSSCVLYIYTICKTGLDIMGPVLENKRYGAGILMFFGPW